MTFSGLQGGTRRGALLIRLRPNMRLKLAGCGGRLKGNGSLPIAAAAPRS
jgi:hypothetical protein